MSIILMIVMREYKYYHPYEPVGYYCWTYNDTIKLNLHFEWTNKNNISCQIIRPVSPVVIR